MADDKTGYSVSGESLKRIGRAVRAVETNQPIPFEEKRRSGFNGPMVEGVFLEDLPGTSDPNTPSYARFQIQTALQGLDGWAKENSPSIIPVWNRSPSSASEGDFGFAKELYPNKWYWVSGGSGGSQIISFSIVSSVAGSREANVEILQRSFTGTVYGSDLGDTVVVVYDTDGCHLNEPNVDLTGRRGKAVLMLTDAQAAAAHFPGDYNPPTWYWNVLTLCCPTIICEG